MVLIDLKKLTAELNAVIESLDSLFERNGMPRVIALNYIGTARANRTWITPITLSNEKWAGPKNLAKELNEIAVSLDSLSGMSRARAIKLLLGNDDAYDISQGAIPSKKYMAPNKIELESVQNWFKNMERLK